MRQFLWGMFCYSLSCMVLAQSGQTDQQGTEKAMHEPQKVSPAPADLIRKIGSDYHNGIRLLQNRFRIDYQVDEITMVFFREYGSPPIVLVRPDGSKIFQGDADGENIDWFDSAAFDMIKIKAPMPGPWQAVGQVLQDSRIMIVSDIRLEVDPLPEDLFSGEILKQQARLSNSGKPIENPLFRDAVNLTMQFISTNNPDYNNFGAQTETVALFEDNGLGMDERPLDGKFTGQFNLAITDGEWKPVFYVDTPMMSREQVEEPIILQPNPIKVDVELDETGDGSHRLLVDVERDKIDINSLLVDGEIRFPGGDIQSFSLTQQNDQVRTHDIINFEYGIFRINLTAFGKTAAGRDFIMDVPEFTFLAPEPKLQAAVEAEADAPANQVESTATTETLPEQATPIETQPEGLSSQTVILIVAGNLMLLLIGGGALWWFLGRSKKPAAKAHKSSSASILDKLSGLFKRKNQSDDNDNEKA